MATTVLDIRQSASVKTDDDALDVHQPGWSRAIVAAVFLAWLAVIWFWSASIYTLTVDDSYYYLKTAANVAAGYGFKFDQINTTNGFHPLWMLLLIPLSWLSGGSMEMFARLAMTLQLAMVYAGATFLASALNDRRRWIVLATAFLMLNFYYAKIVVNALESGLQWFFVCATLAVTLHFLRRDSRTLSPLHWFGLGLLAGLTVLSRLTSVLFIGGVVLLVAAVTWQTVAEAKIKSVIQRVLLIAIGAAIPISLYLVWTYLSTGHFTPVSAAIKTSRDFKVSSAGLMVVATMAVVWLVSCVVLWRNIRSPNHSRDLIWISFPLITYAVLQETADILFRGALVTEIWYMVPQALLVALAAGVMLSRAALRRGLWRTLTLAATVVLVLFAAFTWSYRLDPRSYASYVRSRQMADWLRDNAPPDTIVGSWDAGIVGGYSGRRVADLDGLINSWDYKQNYFDKKLTEKWITDVCPVDYLAQEFWSWQLTPDVLRDYRGVDLMKWKVVYHDSATVRSWSNRGIPAEVYELVLSRSGDGIPMEQFLTSLKTDSSPPTAPQTSSFPATDSLR